MSYLTAHLQELIGATTANNAAQAAAAKAEQRLISVQKTAARAMVGARWPEGEERFFDGHVIGLRAHIEDDCKITFATCMAMPVVEDDEKEAQG